MIWQNRIIEQRRMAVADLKANPLNWRRHPKKQRAALSGALDEVGVVQGVIFNQRTGRLVDGHLRLELALEHSETELTVTVVDLSEEEERLVLATLDPIGALATADDKMISELVASVETANRDLAELLSQISPEIEIDYGTPPPSVERNAEEIATMRAERKERRGDVVNKADTERFLVVVFPTREAKQEALATLGLPGDERYVSASTVEVHRQGIVQRVAAKSSAANKAGATG